MTNSLISRHEMITITKKINDLEEFKSSEIYSGCYFSIDTVNKEVTHRRVLSKDIIGAYAYVKKNNEDPEITVLWVNKLTKSPRGKSKFFQKNIKRIAEFKALKKKFPETFNSFEIELEK